jgi:molybdenum cofactor cytidylyltransferase
MSQSLLSGIRSSPQSNGWVIALGDMPFVKPQTIKIIVSEMNGIAHKSIFRPTFHERPGNPVGLRSDLLDELVALEGDEGAREIIKREKKRIRHIPVDDDGIMKDIDTQKDLLEISKP